MKQQVNIIMSWGRYIGWHFFQSATL